MNPLEQILWRLLGDPPKNEPQDEPEPAERLILMARLRRAEQELRSRGWIALAPEDEDHGK